MLISDGSQLKAVRLMIKPEDRGNLMYLLTLVDNSYIAFLQKRNQKIDVCTSYIKSTLTLYYCLLNGMKIIKQIRLSKIVSK